MAEFWAAVLGRPVDDGSSTEFATIGGADGKRAQPAWYFNKVAEPKRAKNRAHLDLVDPDPLAVDRLIALGATVGGEHELGSHGWTVLQDLEGKEFCIASKSFTR
ncbi:MAG: VOC family protein [Jatrophihabitans sp.]